MGWLLVAFDLPTNTKKERKAAHDFREWLKDDGYSMLQWSVYVRACVPFARQETHLARLTAHLPPEGSIRALFVTRAQWERSFVMHGKPSQEGEEPENLPEQILLW